MNYYDIPTTDLHVSTISMGCMRIAKKSVDEVEVLVKTALDCGINFFDHADIYGGGKSEELFGEVLKRNPELRKQMIIQTKCGIRPGRFDFSKEHILASVENSLRRLQIKTIDVLLLHRPDVLMDPQEIAEAFDELYMAGKVRYFGVSNMDPMQIELLQKFTKHKLIINQLQFNVVHAFMVEAQLNVNMREEVSLNRDNGVLNYCRLNDILIQPWSVLQSNSWNGGLYIDNPTYPELNAKLKELGEKYSISKTAVAIAWILRHPAGMQPIIGTTNPQHMIDTCAASSIQLTREEWYQLYLSVGRQLP